MLASAPSVRPRQGSTEQIDPMNFRTVNTLALLRRWRVLLLAVALALPVVQVGAVWHQLSHQGDRGGLSAPSGVPLLHNDGCGTCLAFHAVGGAVPTAERGEVAHMAVRSALQIGAYSSWFEVIEPPYASRAPPFILV